MRRIILALLLLAATGWATPSRAQWWGGGRPAYGFCGPWTCPGGGWGRPGRVVLVPAGRPWAGQAGAGPGGFGGPGWGWRRWAWQRMYWRRWAAQREARLRRIENWRRWVEAERRWDGRRPARAEGPAQRFTGWDLAPRATGEFAPTVARAGTRQGAPRRFTVAAMRPVLHPILHPPAEAAVALMPASPATPRMAGPRMAGRMSHPALPARILAAAAMIRHPAAPVARRAMDVAPAVLRAPEPPVRRVNTVLLGPHAAPRRGDARPSVLRPVVLRSQPAPATPAVPTAPAAPAPAAAAAAAPGTPPVAPADVPVAPLD